MQQTPDPMGRGEPTRPNVDDNFAQDKIGRPHCLDTGSGASTYVAMRSHTSQTDEILSFSEGD